ncbi:NfeD family protein [Motiliproteus sediminis]|uniref:NfeD family protein n=1 Tax=Motiliproteus sediminis TaxID=1468178 RepID=UPI001AEF3A5A|nr:hypothetical protein [Motiliproteus sediminis]
MGNFFSEPSSIWFLIGFIALAVEAFVLGLSSGLLLFGGLAALLTGALFTAGVLDGHAFGIAPLAVTGIGSGLLALLLWRPLKALQNRKGEMYQENNSDFVGLKFSLPTELSHQSPGVHSYSGIDWKVELDASTTKPVPAGQRLEVVRVRVGCFTVKPIATDGASP